MLKTKLLSLLRFYLKMTIKIIYYMTEKTPLYLVYLFISTYALFGPYVEGGNGFRWFCLIITLYVLLNTGLLFLACKIEKSRKFLSKLLGEEFIIKYLGKS